MPLTYTAQGGLVTAPASYHRRAHFHLLTITIDFVALYNKQDHQDRLKWKIREKKNSGAIFKKFSKSDYISAVHFFPGKGRTRIEKKINLTRNQGNFLLYLPFPTEPFLSVADIIKKAKIEESNIPEVLDIIDALLNHKIIEKR